MANSAWQASWGTGDVASPGSIVFWGPLGNQMNHSGRLAAAVSAGSTVLDFAPDKLYFSLEQTLPGGKGARRATMKQSRWWALAGHVILGLALGLWLAAGVAAQQPAGRLVISGADASTVPSITLTLYGMDGQGQPLSFSPADVAVRHGGQDVAAVTVGGKQAMGTFTLFVVDMPAGIDASLPSIQGAIEQFAAPPTMVEGIDYLAIYQIGEDQVSELLAPTSFHNAVRNFLATPFSIQAGPTALLDSLGSLLDDIETLRPAGLVYTSIVVFTDGTDVVSTDFQLEDIGPKAAGLGVPIHTVWLENESLQPFSHQAGRDYLAGVAAASRGVAARLDQEAELSSIWDRIAAFRDHTLLVYAVDDLSPGDFEVLVSLADQPQVTAETTVTVQPAAASVVINLPPESRTLVLESLDTPIDLSFSATASWLDAQTREVISAQLLVNGLLVADIRPNQLDRFTARIGNFVYGDNTVQIIIVDELGQQATSAPVTLTVIEGQTELPEEFRAGGLAGTPLARILLICGLTLFILVVFALIILVIRNWRRGRQAAESEAWIDASPEEPVWHGAQSPDRDQFDLPPLPREERPPFEIDNPYLEVLRSVTRMPSVIELTDVEHRIGRSPVDNDIVFENDITVSRIHASIVLEGADYRIYDEGSSGGTAVNDQTVPEYGHQLADGDEIKLGAVRLRYRR
jgi:hypothetical protein